MDIKVFLVELYSINIQCDFYLFLIPVSSFVVLTKSALQENRLVFYSHIVKEWSHQSVRQRNAFRSSAVLPTMTCGGATSVLMTRNALKMVTMTPSLFSRSRSVILTAFAERTRKITEILCKTRKIFIRMHSGT